MSLFGLPIALGRFGLAFAGALVEELVGDDSLDGYESTTTRQDPPEAKYRFIREVGAERFGFSLGQEVVAMELRVPVLHVRDASMPEETRAALQGSLGELYDQARDTMRRRGY
jgi:hypothetical protein